MHMQQMTLKYTFRTTLSIVLALIWGILASESSAANFSDKTHYYAIEFLKPVPGSGGISILNVTFNLLLDGKTADQVLREELRRAVTLFPPAGDVMAYSWTVTDPKPGKEGMISLADGSHFLIYLAKTKQTLTEKEYDVSRQQPIQPGKELNIEISLDLEQGTDGRVRIRGKSNLPHGMALMLNLRNTETKYFAQDKVEVVDGRIVSSWFSDRGKPLRAGTYDIGVSSPLPALQPQAVRTIIGQTGENLLGAVRTSMGSKLVEFKIRKTLE